jgi:hypothetical protein
MNFTNTQSLLRKQQQRQYRYAVFMVTMRITVRIVHVKGIGKGHPRQHHAGPDAAIRCTASLTLNSNLDGGGCSTSCSGPFTPRKDKLLTVYEAVWATGTVWRGAEYLAPTGIRSSNRPAHSQPLHPLRYPDPIVPSTAT